MNYPFPLKTVIPVLVVGLSLASGSSAAGFSFRVQKLAEDGMEACEVADFDKDGNLDVSSGEFWWPGPSFRERRALRTVGKWREYRANNGEHAVDVDRDGWADIVSGSFMEPKLFWYRNPGAEGLKAGAPWERKELVDTGLQANEVTVLHDIDHDGRPELVVNSWKVDNPLMAWRFGKDADGAPRLEPVTIGNSASAGNGHGLGFGDIDGDGREDILFQSGWYRRPETNEMSVPWKVRHDWHFPSACIPMLVADLDDDGRNDIVWSDGHGYGLYWEQQRPPAADGSTNWRHHTIERRYSQLHTLAWADLDNDGRRELVAGRRFMAHNGKDPGDTEPPVVLAYAWNAKSRGFSRHVLAEKAGCGLLIRIADLDKDGRVEIVSASKAGTVILWNETKAASRGPGG